MGTPKSIRETLERNLSIDVPITTNKLYADLKDFLAQRFNTTMLNGQDIKSLWNDLYPEDAERDRKKAA